MWAAKVRTPKRTWHETRHWFEGFSKEWRQSVWKLRRLYNHGTRQRNQKDKVRVKTRVGYSFQWFIFLFFYCTEFFWGGRNDVRIKKFIFFRVHQKHRTGENISLAGSPKHWQRDKFRMDVWVKSRRPRRWTCAFTVTRFLSCPQDRLNWPIGCVWIHVFNDTSNRSGHDQYCPNACAG